MNEQLDLELFRPVRQAFVRGMTLAFFVSMALHVVSLMSALYMIQVYDRVIPARSYDTLYGLMVIAVLALVIIGLLDIARNWTFSVLGEKLATSLNLPLLEASVLHSIKGGVSEGANAMRSVADLRSFLSSSAVSLPFDAVFAPISIFALFLIHPMYAIVAAATILIIVLLNIITDILTRPANKKANAAQQRHLQEVASSLRHSETIEAMGMLPALVKGWAHSHTQTLEYSRSASARTRILLGLTKAISASNRYVVISTGAFLVLAGEVSTSVMFAAMILTSLAVGPFSRLVENWRQWTSAFESWKTVRTVIVSADSARQKMPASAGNGKLAAENLVYVASGRQTPILRGLNFTVSPGEVLGIVGPSGSGKSTLARCITGVIKPTAGGIYLDGQSTFLWERGSFGRVTGYVPQNVAMLDGTVRQAISRMQDHDPSDVIRAAQAAGVHELIGKLPNGYDTTIREGQHILSGGQMQRLALARAIFGDPKLLILDEPNSNLDQAGEMALIRAIGEARARGAITVLIAHRPSVMAATDNILVLENGVATQFGRSRDIIANLTGDDKGALRGNKPKRLRLLSNNDEA